MTAVPSISAGSSSGQLLRVLNAASNDAIGLQDETLLSGSKLKLRTPKLWLGPTQSAEFVWDGSFWIEVNRCTKGSTTYLHVADYGAIGTANDGPALQTAMNDAYSLKLPLELDGLVYTTNQELNNQGITIRGKRGSTSTSIRAGAAISSVMKVTGVTDVTDVTFDGNGIATSAIKLVFSSYSTFRSVIGTGAVVDAWLFDDSGPGNDAVVLRDCLATQSGRIYVTSGRATPSSGATKIVASGTVSTTAGSSTIVGTGTQFTQMGIRAGDFIAIGSNAATSEWVMIGKVVNDTTLTSAQFSAPTQTRSTQAFAVFVGDGFHEKPFHDNNNNVFDHCRTLNIAGSGVVCAGIYGPRIDQLQADASGAYAVVVGCRSDTGALAAPQSTRITGLYVETFTEIPFNGVVFVIGANGLEIDSVKAGVSSSIAMPNPSLGYGTISNDMTKPAHVSPIGSVLADVPVSEIAQDAHLLKRIKSASYTSGGAGPGAGSLQLWDGDYAGAFKVISGAEPPAGGPSSTTIAHRLDTWATINNGAAEVDLLTKHHTAFENNGVFLAGVGFNGDLRTTSTDRSGTPLSPPTIDTPSGRFAMAAGANSVTVTNKNVKVGTKVLLSKLSLDSTAKDFAIATAAGSFTVTANANATNHIVFDFMVVNAS